jgi:hypothetical protein
MGGHEMAAAPGWLWGPSATKSPRPGKFLARHATNHRPRMQRIPWDSALGPRIPTLLPTAWERGASSRLRTPCSYPSLLSHTHPPGLCRWFSCLSCLSDCLPPVLPPSSSKLQHLVSTRSKLCYFVQSLFRSRGCSDTPGFWNHVGMLRP